MFDLIHPTLNRAELFRILTVMGIVVPSTSRLSNDALESRLEQAINSSQALLSVALTPPVVPAHYVAWPPGGKAFTTFNAIRRGNMDDVLLATEARKNGIGNPSPLGANPFMDIRQTLMTLARNWDNHGRKFAAVMQDKDEEEQRCAVNIRVSYTFRDSYWQPPSVFTGTRRSQNQRPHPATIGCI